MLGGFCMTTMRTQLAVLQNFGKEKGIAFAVVDDYARRYANINGAQLGGTNKIIVNLDAEGGLLLRTAGHEVFHYLEQQNADAAQKLRDFVVEHYVNEGKYESLAQKYARQGYEGDIESELTADNLFDVMTQKGFLQKYAAEDAGTVRTLRNTVAAFIRHINNALKLLKRTNPIHEEIYDSLNKDKQFLEELRQKATDALDSLPSTQTGTGTDTSVHYSKKADDSIKEQLKTNQNMLNEMNPVAVINEHPIFRNGEDVQKWALSRFKQIGFEVHRQGFGRVILDKKRVQSSLRYFGTYEERVALLAVPKVIKQGKVIDGHENHKKRAYDTVTFAAPVIINGVRGNMAVVVRNERKSYYKVHRIVMPDGSQFSLENEKRDIAERAGRNHEESVLSPADNISTDSIPRGQAESQENLSGKGEAAKPDTKFSLKAPVEETKDLVAVHNISTENLRNAAKLGGFPMPSIAVIKSKQEYDSFGSISLVFRKQTIDPAVSKRNKLFSEDANTGQFPQVEYKYNAEKAHKLNRIYEDNYDKLREAGDETDQRKQKYRLAMCRYLPTNLDDRLEQYRTENGLIHAIYDDTDMINVYRIIRGEPVIKDKDAIKALDQTEYKKWVDSLYKGIVEKAGFRNGKAEKGRTWDELHDDVTVENAVRKMKSQKDASGIGMEGIAFLREFHTMKKLKEQSFRLQEGAWKTSRERSKLADRADDIAKRIGGGLNRFSIAHIIKNCASKEEIRKYVRENFYYNRISISDEIADEILALKKEYENWPTEYFEALPRRAVGFDEVAYAVIPNSDADAAAILDELNVPHVTYEDGNDAARAKVLNEQADKAGDIRFSIKMSTDGERYVQVDENAIDTSDGESVAKNIAAILSKKFNNLVHANGQFVRVNATTNREIRYSDWAKTLKRVTPDWHTDKIKSIANADELLSIAKHWVNENLKHERQDGITSFGKASVLYKVGNRGYEADVFVGLKNDGSGILYDIVNIRQKEITDATNKVGEQAPSRVDASVIDSIPRGQAESQEKTSDLRRSLKPASSISEEHRALIEENEKYKALIQKLNGQIHALQKKVVDPKGVRKLARDVRAEFKSKIDQSDLEDKLTSLFDDISTYSHEKSPARRTVQGMCSLFIRFRASAGSLRYVR